MQGRQVTLVDAEARAQRRHVEQVEHFADGETTVRQLEQVLDGDQQWITATLALVGQGEGNVAWVMALAAGRIPRGCAAHRLSMSGTITITSRGRRSGRR